MKVTMKWNEVAQKWLMHHRDTFIYDFWNCGNVKMMFPGLDKEKVNKFEIIIESLDV